mgnify:CR=1 FL=1
MSSLKKIYFVLVVICLVSKLIVRYKGVNAIIPVNTIIVVGTNIFSIINFMFTRICNYLSILSFLLISSTLIAAGIGYKYLSSFQFKEKLMKEIMSNVSELMPKVLDEGLPNMTGTSIPDKNWTVPKL